MNILIIRFSSLGDVILATAFVKNVRDSFPEAEISFYTKEEYIPVLENNPNINYILVFRKKWGTFKNFIWLSRREFDIVYDLHSNLRSFLLKKILRYGQFHSYYKASKERKLLVKTKKFSGAFLHAQDRYNEILKKQALKISQFKPQIYLSDEEIQWGRSYFKEKIPESDPPPEIVGLACGAKWETKKWIPERYMRLALEIRKLGCQVVFIGENPDKNMILPFYGQLKKEEKEGIHILLGELDLRKLFTVISHMRLLITTDSAPMHIARAFDVKVVLIAGPTVKEFGFFPKENEGAVVEASPVPSCRPCSLHGSKKCRNHMQTFECMKNIKVEDVMLRARKLLGKEETKEGKSKEVKIKK